MKGNSWSKYKKKREKKEVGQGIRPIVLDFRVTVKGKRENWVKT